MTLKQPKRIRDRQKNPTKKQFRVQPFLKRCIVPFCLSHCDTAGWPSSSPVKRRRSPCFESESLDKSRDLAADRRPKDMAAIFRAKGDRAAPPHALDPKKRLYPNRMNEKEF